MNKGFTGLHPVNYFPKERLPKLAWESAFSGNTHSGAAAEHFAHAGKSSP